MKFIALVLLFSAGILSAQQTVITGKILGYDGKPMPMAHVHLAQRYYPRAFQSVEAQKDGTFSLKTEAKGLFDLQFTGVNHIVYTTPVLIEQPATMTVTAHLAPDSFPDTLNGVSIVGDFNEFSFESAVPMNKQTDGTYRVELDSKGSTLSYQILPDVPAGSSIAGHSINGTQSDSYEYDGGGDYRSIVRTSNGKAVIIFDPKKTIHITTEAVITFSSPVQQHLAEQLTDLGTIERPFYSAYLSHKAQDKDIATFHYDLSPMLKKYSDGIQQAHDPLSRSIAMIGYIKTASLAFTDSSNLPLVDRKLVRRALDEIPPSSYVWVIDPNAISQAIQLSDNEKKYSSYLQNVLHNHPDSTVRKNLFRYELARSSENGDTVKTRAYFTEFMRTFGNSREAETIRYDYDPDRAIQVGRPVPAFSVASLDNEAVVYTNETMKGKVYMLDFWAVWCGPCIGEMPGLHKAYEKFKGRNFEVLSLSFDREPGDVTRFRNKGKFPMPWLHTFANGGFEGKLGKTFEVSGIPKPILVNENGIIIATGTALRGENLEKTLARVLKAN